MYRWTKKDSQRHELLAPLVAYDDNQTIEVPKGFKTDFASIPRIFRVLIEPTGKHSLAAVLHDYLYTKGSQMGISRKRADKIFYDAMRNCFVNIITANIMWFCVRVFAASHYKS